MANFEDADKAVLELFENEVDNAPEENITEEVPEETLTDDSIESESEEQLNAENVETPVNEEIPAESPTPEQKVTEEAVNVAEQAAYAAQEKEMQYQQVMNEVTALREQNEQMHRLIREISDSNKEEVVEDVLQMPSLDVSTLAFKTEEEVKQAQEKYANEMAEYVKKGIMNEISPFIEQAKEGLYQKEKTETIEALSQIPELKGIKAMLPQLDNIIASNKWLQSDDMDMDEKYINAYAIASGVNSITAPPPEEPKEPTAEELMAYYEKNPAFQELIEKKRIEQVKESQQVPNFSASSGAVNAALNIKEKPKTLEEAHRLTALGFESL